jgi:3-deoxy-D-manno-octulosonate 8-phosphate phosphatase (KDO 8-P phosphatase)
LDILTCDFRKIFAYEQPVGRTRTTQALTSSSGRASEARPEVVRRRLTQNRGASLRWAGETPAPTWLVELNAKIPAMPKTLSAKARAKKIKLLLFDVDGVLTDGKLFLFPVQTANGQIVVEAKGFHAQDGAGISIARIGGIQSGLITRRKSETVALRARNLKLEYVRQGSLDKLKAFREILADARLGADEVAFVGDDVIDLPAMRNCGFSVAVANARPEVKAAAHYVTPHAGGDGAARDAIEFILKAQGKWKQAVETYIKNESPGGN